MKFFLSTICIFCFSLLDAQINDSISVENEVPWSLKSAKKYWKFSPLEIFSVVPTFGVDVEVDVRESFAVQGGVGIVPPFFQFLRNNDTEGYDGMGGYKLRAEGKMYMPFKTNRYISVGVSFRHLIIRDEVMIGMEPFNNAWGGRDFAYFQSLDMLFHRFNTHLDVKYGFQKVKTGGLVLDFYTGLSLRAIQVKSGNTLPAGGEIPPTGGIWTLRNNHSLTYPTPILGLKIGFTK